MLQQCIQGLGKKKDADEAMDGRLKRLAKILRVEPSNPVAGKVSTISQT